MSVKRSVSKKINQFRANNRTLILNTGTAATAGGVLGGLVLAGVMPPLGLLGLVVVPPALMTVSSNNKRDCFYFFKEDSIKKDLYPMCALKDWEKKEYEGYARVKVSHHQSTSIYISLDKTRNLKAQFNQTKSAKKKAKIQKKLDRQVRYRNDILTSKTVVAAPRQN